LSFRTIICAVMLFLFVPAFPAGSESSHEMKNEALQESSQKYPAHTLSPFIGWLNRQPFQWIWTSVGTYTSSKMAPDFRNCPELSGLNRKSRRKKSARFSRRHDNIAPYTKLKGSRNEDDYFGLKSQGANLTYLPEFRNGKDIMNDAVRPEIVGRTRRRKPGFEIGSSSLSRFGNFKRERSPNLSDAGRFNDKIDKLSFQSGDFSKMNLPQKRDSNNVSGQRNWIGYRRELIFKVKDTPKKIKRKTKKLILEDEEGPFRLSIKADEIRYYRGMAMAEGNVEVVYRGVKLEADKLSYNRYSREIDAKGKVVFSREGDMIMGSSLHYNPLAQQAEIKDAYGRARDITVGEVELQQTIFFWGDLVKWQEGIIYIKKGRATTCDVSPPDYHYHITGDEIIIYPREKMIVRKARFFFGKSQWLGLNSMVFPLRQRDPRMRQSFIPQIGNNEQEGLYVKEAVGYLWGKRDYGTLHLDWYQKVGIGAGIEHNYHLGDRGAGKVYYYRMGASTSSKNRYNFSNRVYYRFPGNYFMSFNYSNERYEFPEYSSPDIRNADFYISHSADKTKTAFHIKDYIVGRNRHYGFNLLNRYNFNERLQSQAVIDFLSSENSLKRLYRLNTLGRLVYKGDVFESSLTYDQTGGDRKFYVNREPELALRTKDLHLGNLDYKVSMAAGNFKELPSDISALRSDLKLSLLNKLYPLTASTDFSVAGGVRQLLYGTGEKKYVVRSQAGLEQKMGKNVSLIATHYFQERKGASPLALDYFEKYNVLGGTVEFYNRKNLRMQVTGGYDLNHKQYQSMIPRLEYCPSREWSFLFSSNYDVRNKTWMNVDGELGVKLAKQVAVKYWGLYDLINKKMTYQNYVLELDSHDFATRLIYKGSQGELWLSLAIKAFPYEKVDVGADSNRNIVDKGLLERAPDEEGL